MRTTALVIVAALIGAAVALIARTVFDAPWLGWVAVGLLLLALVARGVWLCDSRSRLTLGLLGLIVLAGFLYERLMA